MSTPTRIDVPGASLAATSFEPASPARAAVVFAPAMGVPQRYYAPFATYLAERGFLAVTFDYRSDPGATLRDWGEKDLAGVLSWAAGRAEPVLLVAHSVGGQVFGLIERAPVSAALLVGAQHGHWRLWPGLPKLGMALLWHVVIPAVVPLAGRLPGRLLGGDLDVPREVALEWARWGRHPDYLFSYATPKGGLGFSRFAGPLRSYAIADDRYAPPPTVKKLAEGYRAAKVELVQLRPEDAGAKAIGHFGFFRSKFKETLWRQGAEWLEAQADAGRSSPARPSGS